MILNNKVAIVTGGAMGIGRALAEGLASEGANLVIADIAGAKSAADAMIEMGWNTIGIDVDVSSEQDTEKMAKETIKTFGRIDILVNNAGIYSSLLPTPFEKIKVAEWRKVMDVNTMGVFLCCRAVISEMRKLKGGRIINISSGSQFRGTPFFLHYTASKGAVVAMTRVLATELGKDKILVNSISPGFTLSDGIKGNKIQMEHFREISQKARPLKKDSLPEDLVGAVKFFAGPDSNFITGQTLVVDGGSYFH